MGSSSICAKIVDWDESLPNKYVVVFSRYEGRLLLSRHKDRDTWETQGGHIEPGESPEDAARRELWEESGAEDFTLEPVCMYWAEDRVDGKPESGAWGAIFFADIKTLGPMPESEMAEARGFDALPENVTYPYITPHIFGRVRDRFKG
ncbi:NUDIX hydrolase [Acutalibacter muris]|jgi:8-oxo-dGTP diphosphatase|uniref:NUDIX hydrolase n=1 Tax=Acutalibacter muris TaxID=1796620 RepID=UPI0025B75046|nr:NUDIX domain-containing protein [Acutalibacter muris]MCI9193441.1 NUDIX domain-containing protein [Acutalibacter muris]MCI9543155.1 NUDIX domain-containing protein [Acutalibacter muris]